MKKFVSVLAVLLLVCFVLTVFVACKKEEADTLVIYNWADYIFNEGQMEKEFKSYYKAMTGKDVEITYVTFDTNETMLTRLTKGDSNVDVVCPSEYAIQKLIEMDMLVPLHYFDEEKYVKDFTKNVDSSVYVHNADNVEQGIRDKVGETFGNIEITADNSKNKGKQVSMLDYFVPYMYGTLGILYNKFEFERLGIYDSETLNKANWGILFNDNGEGEVLSDGLTGNILMKDSIRDSYAATVFYLLESGGLDELKNSDGKFYTEMSASELINEVDDNLLELVKDALKDQKRQLFGYEVDFGKDDLLSGNAMVDLAWSGDAMYAVEESWDDEREDYELAYYLPHSTGNIWFDGWVVPTTYDPDHWDAIKLFINYLNRPNVAAKNLLEIGYTAAIKPQVLLDDENAMRILAEGYEYDPDDPDEMAEFTDYFFHYEDEIDLSNWRYPFESAEINSDNYRNIDSLGVMRDFGNKNHDVVTAWNYARSAGVSALPMLGWTALAVVVVVGLVCLIIWLKRLKSHNVRLR